MQIEQFICIISDKKENKLVEGTYFGVFQKCIVFVKSLKNKPNHDHLLFDTFLGRFDKHIIGYEKKLSYASEKLGLEVGSPFFYKNIDFIYEHWNSNQSLDWNSFGKSADFKYYLKIYYLQISIKISKDARFAFPKARPASGMAT